MVVITVEAPGGEFPPTDVTDDLSTAITERAESAGISVTPTIQRYGETFLMPTTYEAFMLCFSLSQSLPAMIKYAFICVRLYNNGVLHADACS